MMKELLIELQPIIYQGLIVLITSVGAYFGSVIKKNFDYKRMVDIVKKTVEYVEELGYQDELLKGSKKFEMAKEKAFIWLKERNIPFSEVELEILINALVNEMRKEEGTNE